MAQIVMTLVIIAAAMVLFAWNPVPAAAPARRPCSLEFF